MVNSPFSYIGNKYKILSQILPKLNSTDFSEFVDVFAGSGLVAINSEYNEIVLNDNNKNLIELIEYFYINSSKKIINDVETLISDYKLTYSFKFGKQKYPTIKNEGLSNYNREGYNALKDDYNQNQTPDKLLVLLIYGFNHYLRYNSKGEFNVPVGKMDVSTSIYEKIINYSEGLQKKNITFSTLDFLEESLYNSIEALYYFDPPYLITTAPYNTFWSKNNERELYELLDKLDSENKKFALSNVFECNGKENTILKEWSKKYNVNVIEKQYKNSNYRKRIKTGTIEVLITNF